MPSMRIEVLRQQLRDARAVPDPDAPDSPEARALADGQARLRIDRFALTANNVTYAAFGDAMGYWRFFPATAADRGVVPVWGFAEVVESRHGALPLGERFYGFWPMASHLVVTPSRVGSDGFTDGAPHRAELPSIYNRYLRGPAAPPDVEDRRALLQPLFTTAFLIDDFLAEARFFDAGQVLLSSASSKTAWSTAFCLSRRDPRERPRIVGLTSGGHLDAVRALGLYDEVCAYDDLERLDADVRSVYVDMAGSAPLRRQVHARWGDRLGHSAAVGGAHWQAIGGAEGLPGPRPTLFFAPAQAAKRAEPPPKGWGRDGPDGLPQRVDAAWRGLVAWLERPGAPTLHLDRAAGADATAQAWTRLVDGAIAPDVGLVRGLGAALDSSPGA